MELLHRAEDLKHGAIVSGRRLCLATAGTSLWRASRHGTSPRPSRCVCSFAFIPPHFGGGSSIARDFRQSRCCVLGGHRHSVGRRAAERTLRV